MLLDVGKELTLLPASVTDKLGINVVGVLSAPLEESLVTVADALELELANDGGDRGSWLGLHKLVAK